MIRLSNITKKYNSVDNPAVDNISYYFPDIGLFYIVGPSGSGKTTLLNILATIEENFEGTLIIDNKNVRDLTSDDKDKFRFFDLSLAFQSDELEREKKVKENIIWPIEAFGLSKRAKNERLDKISSILNIKHLYRKKVNTLSGGEKRRVCLARALIKEAKIYLLDEPLNGLDKALREEINSYLEKLSEKALVIVVTHNQEIPDSAGLINIRDGKLTEVRKSSIFNRQIGERKQTKKKAFFGMIKDAIKKIFFNKRRALLATTSISLSLTCFGISELLMTEVKDSIVEYLSGNIAEDGLLVEQKQFKFLQDEKENVENRDLEKIEAVFEEYVEGYSSYYTGDINLMFPNSNKVQLLYKSDPIRFNNLSFSSFLNTFNISEVIASNETLENNLKQDELYIGITSNTLLNIAGYLGVKNSINDVNEFVKNNRVNLELIIENVSWKYKADVAFTIKGFIAMQKDCIIHTDIKFTEKLVEEELELIGSNKLESMDTYPWSLKKHSYVLVHPNKQLAFISEFYDDPRFINYNFSSLYNYDSYKDENISLKRIGIIKNTHERFNPSIINSIDRMTGSNIHFYTSSFYSFADEGLYAGFSEPFYLSSQKKLINKLIDDNTINSTQEEIMPSLNIIPPENVICGDLYSNIKNKGFTFDVVDESYKDKLKHVEDIVLTSSLASYIGYDEKTSKTIHYAYLSEVKRVNGVYKNIYLTGEFNVVGVIEGNQKKIYQGEHFLKALALLKFNKTSAFEVYKVLIKTGKKGEDLKSIRNILQKNNENYYFSIPSISIKKSISPTIDLLSKGMLIFSIASLIIASVLVSYIISLLIVEDKKSIGTRKCFGVSKKEIRGVYILATMIYGLISFVYSSSSLIGINYIFNNSLNDFLGIEIGTSFTTPILHIFIISFFLSLLSGIITSYKAASLKPLVLFKK